MSGIPGAGVNHELVVVGRKRLKKMHRASGGGVSFKEFVRGLAKTGNALAKTYLFNKSIAFSTAARKQRADRVRAGKSAGGKKAKSDKSGKKKRQSKGREEEDE